MPDPSPPAPGAWPLLKSLRELTPTGVAYDALAGLAIAAVAVPEQMATARLGGFAPQVGLFAFAAAAAGFALFGASRKLSVGADSTITPIFAGSLALIAVAGSPQYASLAAALAVLVGLVLLVAGLLKLGWIADLLSAPVLTGFLAGVAIHIAISQAPSVLGLPDGAGSLVHRIALLAGQIGRASPASAAVGLGVFAVVFIGERLGPRAPSALVAVAAASLVTAVFGLGRYGVEILGAVNGGLPRLTAPIFGLEYALRLVSLSFVVALVVMVQTAATARAFAAEGEDPDIDRDFIGVGAASALAGLVGGFPVNASPPRTAIADAAGARSQVSGLVAGLIILLLAAFGARLLAYVPKAALGGVLLFVAQRIFRLRSFVQLARRAPSEFALAALTTVLIVALPIQTGVAIGIFLSLAHGVFIITRVRPIVFERVPGATVWWPAMAAQPGEREPGVLVIGFQAPLSYLNAYEFRRGVLEQVASRAGVRLVVLEASSIVAIDLTAADILAKVIADVRAAGADFAVARLESVRARAAFDRFGITELLGDNHIHRSVEDAVRALAHG